MNGRRTHITRLLDFGDSDTSIGYVDITFKGFVSAEYMEQCIKDYALKTGFSDIEDFRDECDFDYDEKTGILYLEDGDYFTHELKILIEKVLDKCPNTTIKSMYMTLDGSKKDIQRVLRCLNCNNVNIEIGDGDIDDQFNIHCPYPIDKLSVYFNRYMSRVKLTFNLPKPLVKLYISTEYVYEIEVDGIKQENAGLRKDVGVEFQVYSAKEHTPATEITFKNCEIKTFNVLKYTDETGLGCNIKTIKGLRCVKNINFINKPFDKKRHERLTEKIENIHINDNFTPYKLFRLAQLFAECNKNVKNPADITLKP